jgi:hypothetical protein
VKLVVPYIGAPQVADNRLICLAECLGISCQLLPLVQLARNARERFEGERPEDQTCLVINPSVIKEWIGEENVAAEFVSCLLSHFPWIIVHAVRPEPFHDAVVAAISGGALRAVKQIESTDLPYRIAADSEDICETFAGISFGSANPANDRVFAPGKASNAVRELISVGRAPLMAAVKRQNAEILFLGSEGVANLSLQSGDAALAEYFSQLLPHAMALRYIFGAECWRPRANYASIIIDDPLLRPSYGFLKYEQLLGLIRQHNFHTTIAFIPHNCRRSSPQTAKLFRENADCLGICFHGNDHTQAEFASTDPALLNTMLDAAERRIGLHTRLTGLDCDRVMVFPQGKFSVEAMTVLKARNFNAAVNTVPHPMHTETVLTLEDLMQPAVLRFGSFPLFLRKKSIAMESADIAFNLFFGRPILIVEHHDVFAHPEQLISAVQRINSTSRGVVRWSNVGTVVRESILCKRTANGSHHVRAYARCLRITNDSKSHRRVLIEWKYPQDDASEERVLHNGTPCKSFASGDSGIHGMFDMDPGTSETFSLDCKNPYPLYRSTSLRVTARAFVRRRLSEMRDNVLSKNPELLAAAKTVQQRLLPSAKTLRSASHL